MTCIRRRLQHLEADNTLPLRCSAGEQDGGWLLEGRARPLDSPSTPSSSPPHAGRPAFPGISRHLPPPSHPLPPSRFRGRLRQTALSRAWRDLDLRHWQPVPHPRDLKYWYLPDRRAVPADGLGPLSTTWLLEPVSNTPRPHTQPTLTQENVAATSRLAEMSTRHLFITSLFPRKQSVCLPCFRLQGSISHIVGNHETAAQFHLCVSLHNGSASPLTFSGISPTLS